MKRALLIFGPTASGKSALAMALADLLGGEIVNADSMQVYRDLRVLTARPGAEDEARIPHHLYGHVDGAERYSVGRWLPEALAAIADIQGRGVVPIIVGGTGLYFTALTRGLADIPPIDPEVAAALEAALQAEGASALHAQLVAADPVAAARIQPTDPQRILRALGVFRSSGSPLSELQAATNPPLPRQAWFGAVLATETDRRKSDLRLAVARRAGLMLRSGAREEVAALHARGLDPSLPIFGAIGVGLIGRPLWDEAAHAIALEGMGRLTQHYIKRQETWARGQFPYWAGFPAPADEETALKIAEGYEIASRGS